MVQRVFVAAMTMALSVMAVTWAPAAAAPAAPAAPPQASAPALDFDFYRARVEPIFLAKRTGNVRCVQCHAPAAGNLRLQLADAKLQLQAETAVRLLGWAALAWWSLKAVALYALAYVLFVHVLRFADCFQHTYDAYPILGDAPIPNDKVRDRAYEQANTYSDVVSVDARWLNLIWLNFGFHNAHHERPVADRKSTRLNSSH